MNELPRTVYTVSDINKYIKHVLTNDEHLKYLFVKGEISNFKIASNGHLYFSLKDENSSISCVMFNNYASQLKSLPKEGDEVTLIASIDVYSVRGTYNLMVYYIEEVGKGKQLIEFEELKKKLTKEGLFDESKKREINLYPNAIGIITAISGAAIKDMVLNIKRRYPIADIYVFPSQVQGENAPKELIKAFLKAQTYNLDTLIIGRGGGASEDLSAFNDEELIRVISKSKMPVISAVGHEADFTLVDFVADKRASTPTGAAEIATIDIREIRQKLSYSLEEMENAILNIVDDMEQKVSFYKDKMNTSINHIIDVYERHIKHQKEQLNAYNPSLILKRGYSVMTNDQGQVIKSIKQVKRNDKVRTILSDGEVQSSIDEIKEK